jgi:putative aldouronate transport system substrate-binding protein
MIYTYGQNMNAVSSTSEDPETAFKFFNWLYASQENFDLFHYGVEGTHYTLDENGRIDQVLNESGTAIYNMETWQTGYVPYIRYTKDTTENYIDYYTYKSDNYVVSPIAGFIFDASNVQSELTNLQTELIASIYPIKVGMVSYDENIDNAIAKLKAAGLDTYLEEYRKQFAEYLKANPDVLEEAKGNQTK